MRTSSLTWAPDFTGRQRFIIWHWYAWMPNDQFVSPVSISKGSDQSAADPYLSLVVTVRTDYQSGNLLQRAQAFVDAWINQAKRYNLSSELILVEWNPPADCPRLRDALRRPENTRPCNVRIIELSPATVQRYRHSKALSLNPLIAKNVGIRRARGDFILATNIHLLFSDELVAFLASGQLKTDRIYRIDRYDVKNDVPLEGTLDEQLTYCRTNVTGICTKDGIFRVTEDALCAVEERDITDAASGIHFGRGWIPVEQHLSGPLRWIANHAEVIAEVPHTGAELNLELEPGLAMAEPAELESVDRDGNTVGRWTVTGRTMIRMVVPSGPDGRPQKFRFRVPQTGAAPDPWAQNFCVYRCNWVSRPVHRDGDVANLRDLRFTLSRLLSCYLRTRRIGASLHAVIGARRLLLTRGEDVFHKGGDFIAGKGWHAVEHFENEKYRWISPDAELLVRCPNGRLRVALLVEPGPSVGYLPFTFVVRQPNGTLLAKARVDRLTYVELPPIQAEIGYAHLIFNAEDCGEPVQLPGDPRLMICRIHACGFQPGQTQPAGDRNSSVWPSGAVALPEAEIDSRARREQSQRELAALGASARLHIYGCGDFTLMARDHWFNLRGFPELDQYSPQLEAVLCYSAHYAGLQQEILSDPMRIYRIGNSLGPAWTSKAKDEVFEPMPPSNIACVTPEDLFALMNQMRTVNCPVIFNLHQWGLAESELAEASPAPLSNV